MFPVNGNVIEIYRWDNAHASYVKKPFFLNYLERIGFNSYLLIPTYYLLKVNYKI